MSAAFESAVCGAVGAAVALTCVFPLTVAKTRLQAQARRRRSDPKTTPSGETTGNERGNPAAAKDSMAYASDTYRGTLDCIRRIMRKEGVASLYSGIYAALVKAVATNFIFYFCFGALESLVHRLFQKAKGMRSFFHGVLAGICVQLIVLPADTVVTRKLAQSTTLSSWEIMRELVRTDGFWALWSGFLPGLSLTLNPGITTLVRDYITRATRKLTFPAASKNFFAGLLSKLTASVATYPLVVFKVQMQTASMSKHDSLEKLRLSSILANIWRERGFLGFYAGLLPQLSGAVLKEAILNSVRLEIRQIVRRIFFTSASGGKS